LFINVARVRKAFGSAEKFEFKEQFLNLADGNVEFTKPAEVQVKATNLGHSILLQGQIHTEAKLNCSRCLEAFSLVVNTEFEQEICHIADVGAYLADHPEAVEEENYTVFSSDEIELDSLINEHIVLDLPMKPLCSEDCKGLCPTCGHNLNLGECGCDVQQVDPRLAGLAEFFTKE